jgi:hypothetical protein
VAAATVLLICLAAWGLWRTGAGAPGSGHRHGGGSEHAGEAVAEQEEIHDLGAGREDLRLGLRDSHPAVRARAVAELAAIDDRASVPDIIALLEDPSTAVRENAARALGDLGDPSAAGPLGRAMSRPEEDEWVRLHAAISAARLGNASALRTLLEIAREGEARLARREAVAALVALSGVRPREDPAEQVRAIERWLEESGPALTWDPATRTFRRGGS